MRLRILSDGTAGEGTKVLDVDTGADLTDQITAIWWRLDASGVATAAVEFIGTEVDVIGEMPSDCPLPQPCEPTIDIIESRYP